MALTFRSAVEADTGLILQFIRALAEYEKMLDLVVADEELLADQLFRKKNAEVIFAVEDGKEVVFALYFHNFSTFLGRSGLYLEDLFVYPEHRGKGYGKAVMAQVIEKCESLLVEYATLGAKYDKKGFYQSLGFEEYGDIFYEEGIPHIMMKKLVTELLF